MRLFLIPLLAITATAVDWAVINYTSLGGWIYILAGWFLVWLLLFFILRRKWLVSIGTVMVVAVGEDLLFLMGCWLLKGRPLYPLYCHSWLPYCYNWGGIPSYYVIGLLIGGYLIWLRLILNRRRSSIRLS